MPEFTLPFKPEELLAQPADDRLWAKDLPPVDDWTAEQMNAALDKLIGRLLSSQGKDLANEKSFSLLFAIFQAWPRLEESHHPRIVDLLADAARRLVSEAGKLRKLKPSKEDKPEKQSKELRTASKVAAFFLRWAAERLFRQQSADAGRGRGRGRGAAAKSGNAVQQAEQAAANEEAKETQKAMERQRSVVLTELSALMTKGAMPWLWISDAASWQQTAQAVSDGGFYALESAEALKHRETKQASLRCIAEPLLQEGQQHSNLLVATVSKLIHGLRGGEGGAVFAADCLLHAHATPLPRLFLIDLTQHCNPQELSSQGAFQRSLAALLVAVAERLPHVVLANISVLLPLLDVDCYPLRQAIVESIGQLLSSEGRKLPSGAHCSRSLTHAENGEEAEENPAEHVSAVSDDTFTIADATKKDLMETLMARTLDKSVWVRYRVLQTLTGLASNTRTAALPKEQWPRVLEIAIRRMQDSASMSRKASMQLMRTLVEFHPYGPALKGSGDERLKSEKLMKEIGDRFEKLKAEELAELEGREVQDDAKADEENEGAEEAEEGAQTQQQDKRRRIGKKTLTDQSIVREVDRDLDAEGAVEAVMDEEGASARHEAREKQREALKRMQDCYAHRLHFVELLDAAGSRLRSLLASKTSTDVTEAISVVVELRLRGVPAAACAFQQVLGLVWSRHAPIKDAAVDAFYRMYLEGRDDAAAAAAILEIYGEGCSNGSWTHTHLASVQELVQEAGEKKLVSPRAIIPGLLAGVANGSSCPAALRALTALAASSEGSAGLVAAMPKLVELMGSGGPSVGATPEDRLERTRLLCQLLMRLQGSCKSLSEETCADLVGLSQHATLTVVEHFVRCEIPAQWFGAAQAAMDFSFELASVGVAAVDSAHRSPDKVWERVLNSMLCSLLGGKSASAAPVSDSQALVPLPQGGALEPSQLQGAAVQQLCAPQLGCVAFVAGHLSLKMLIFLEGMQSGLKKHRLAEEEKKMAEQREKKKEDKKKVGKSKKGKGKGDEEAPEEDSNAAMGGVGQEEREAEAFAEIAEHSLLYSNSRLLDRVKPLLFACLLDKKLRQNAVLRRLGAIGLCKFMTVSKRFCQENLKLLFSVLFPKAGQAGALGAADAEDACGGDVLEDLTLRQALLVAVGDLLFRHPNVVEPWTGRLYATLSGPINIDGESETENAAADLRLTSLLVLTHLVLNDMIKPRPAFLIRALWLTASAHEPTSKVARILFQELSKRTTNVVYNLLPEIIARLPEYEQDAGEADGRKGRVQYIMQFVEKEKHIEGLIEKFSLRLEQCAGAASGVAAPTQEVTDTAADAADVDAGAPAEARDTIGCLAHALGSMNYSDRCILRLHDLVVVRKALKVSIAYNPVVGECLMGIVEKARKPRPGKEKAADGPPADAEAGAAPADGNAEGGAKGSGAAAAALDALEQTINALTKGKDNSGEQADVDAGPALAVRQAVGDKKKTGSGKRKGAPDANAEEDETDEKPGRSGGGRGRGKGRGRGRGTADKENAPAKAAPVAGGALKRRKAVVDDDDEE